MYRVLNGGKSTNLYTFVLTDLWQHTNTDGLHGSTATPIAVGSYNTDSVYYIVRQNDWNTCCTGGEWTETWTNSHGVVDRSPTIILWRQPLYCEDNAVLAIVLNSGRWGPGRRREICSNSRITNLCKNCSSVTTHHRATALS